MKRVILLPALAIMACSSSGDKLKKLAALPVDEVSGIEYVDGMLWALEDHGNKNRIYKVGFDGKLEQQITLKDVKNNDWEEIASDNQGNLYIGDFGNNENDRIDLAIYKVQKDVLSNNEAEVAAITSFYYPEQKDFPPKKSGRFFDVEAFFEHSGHFYLFTKNRSAGFNGELFVYKVPNAPGKYAAKKIATLHTCGMYKKCAVTAADISPDGKTAVLLAGDRLWLLTGFGNDDFANATMQEYTLGHHTQKEGICFKDANTLLITDEKDKKGGGNLYEVKISDLKGEAKAE